MCGAALADAAAADAAAAAPAPADATTAPVVLTAVLQSTARDLCL